MTALGIDAGGSATRYVVVDAANTVLASGALAPIDGHLFVPEHRARFEAVAAELAQATAGFAPQSIVAGITGLTGDAPEARQAEAIFATALGATAVRVEDDLGPVDAAALLQPMPVLGRPSAAGSDRGVVFRPVAEENAAAFERRQTAGADRYVRAVCAADAGRAWPNERHLDSHQMIWILLSHG